MPWFVVNVCSCYCGRWTHFGGVSLNRSEQQIFEYIEANREERHFWEYKVRAFASKSMELTAAAHLIEGELWRYYVERAAVVPEFKRIVEREGLRRVSMHNLADHLLRLWVAPRPVKRPQPDLLE
jgi:hypothetical protein